VLKNSLQRLTTTRRGIAMGITHQFFYLSHPLNEADDAATAMVILGKPYSFTLDGLKEVRTL
tara:strand:- start:62 stop:247 length:186 start_codon:yes stop_codon:yes gene_type:complete